MLSLPDYPVRQRDFLLEISRAITARLDLTEVLRRVLHASVVMTAARVGLIALKSPDDSAVNIRAYTGIHKDHIPAVNQQLREIMTSVYEHGLEYDYLNKRLIEMTASLRINLKQAVTMPLIFDQKPLGLLIVFRSYQSAVTADDMQILHSFADQAAIAVHNAQLYENINQERQRLSAILNYSGDGVMVLDANLNISNVNRAFEHMTAWHNRDAKGRAYEEVIIWDKIEQDNLSDSILDTWTTQHNPTPTADTRYVQGDLQRRDGLTISVGITYAPLFNSEGKLSTIIANMRDITNFRRAQEMQNVFISTVSHELRTPVALIKGYANTLSREDVQWDQATVRNSLNIIEDEADRLTVLIDDLLIASKIQTEHDVQLNKADVNFQKLSQATAERFTTQTQHHRLVLSFTDNFPIVSADERLMRQVIDNLITNAIKYSPNGGTITLGGRYNDQTVTLFVRDEGSGISDADQNRIFERFFRVENSLTSKTSGTGLGLYLVKAIIDAHHGTISVKSQIGQGSTFFFTLPRD